MSQRQIIVIGGGPAGLMAAGQAAQLGARVTLLEKMDTPGRKLFISGKGRCNITKEVCKNKIPFLKWSGRIGRQKG